MREINTAPREDGSREELPGPHLSGSRPSEPRLGREHLDEPIFSHLRRDFTPLRIHQTVGEALEFLRSQNLGERIVYFYVVDAEGRLQGVVPTRRLLMSSPSASIGSIMVTRVVTLPTWATVREACEAFLQHRFLAFPVVDQGGYLHGTADVSLFADEIADLAERQAADDVFQLIGVHVAHSLTPWSSFRDRFPWLLCNVGGGLLAAFLASRYESLLDAVVLLALFIPVVLALAESVSIQSLTITLQSMHVAPVNWPFFWRSLRKEVSTATLLGMGCGALVGSAAWIWRGAPDVAAAIFVAITVSMITACILGVALPTIIRAFRGDPKIAAGPIVLALADIATLLFYFNLAGLLMG